MKPSCPCCGRADFSYRSLLSVFPYKGESSPKQIACPSCGAALRITNGSRLRGLLIGLLLSFGILWLAQMNPWLAGWQFVAMFLGAIAFDLFILWPLVVRFKPWTPFQLRMAESPLFGFIVFLLLPVGAVGMLLYLLIVSR
jgi:hypothetical protein